MSYVLDALKRSEQDRNKGQIPNLSDQGALMHLSQPKRQWWPYALIAMLVLNVLVYGYFNFFGRSEVPVSETARNVESSSRQVVATHQEVPPAGASREEPALDPLSSAPSLAGASNNKSASKAALGQGIDWQAKEREAKQLIAATMAEQQGPTIPDNVPVRIDPYQSPRALESSSGQAETTQDQFDVIKPKRIPPGGALPFPEPVSATLDQSVVAVEDSNQYADVKFLYELDNQPRVPKLKFNSHIYSDTPDARRVMINNIYLREGQALSGLEILRIGEKNIVFRKGGTLFKLPAMRDWEG